MILVLVLSGVAVVVVVDLRFVVRLSDVLVVAACCSWRLSSGILQSCCWRGPGRGWCPTGVDLDLFPRWPGVTVGLWSLGSRLVVSTLTLTKFRIFLIAPEPLVREAAGIFTVFVLGLEFFLVLGGAFSQGLHFSAGCLAHFSAGCLALLASS